MIEASGLWRAVTYGDRELSLYCSPGSWTGSLTPDEYDGEDVYLEYEPVCAIFDLSTGSLSEHSLGESPLRHCVIPGSGEDLNRMGDSGPPWAEWPKRLAGYESTEGTHKYFVHYRALDESSFSILEKLFAISTAGTVLGDTDELEEPGPLALWAGDVVAVDGSVKKI
jgi:hypothetical protein